MFRRSILENYLFAFYLQNRRQQVFVLTLTLFLVASIPIIGFTQSKYCIFQLWREINAYAAVCWCILLIYKAPFSHLRASLDILKVPSFAM